MNAESILDRDKDVAEIVILEHISEEDDGENMIDSKIPLLKLDLLDMKDDGMSFNNGEEALTNPSNFGNVSSSLEPDQNISNFMSSNKMTE
jgi:hypothetical protein